MSWKKINIKVAYGKYVFSDNYGFGRIDRIEIKLIVGKKEFSPSNFYIKEGNAFYNKREVNLDSLFSTIFYKKKQTQDNRNCGYYGYGYNDSATRREVTEVNIDSYIIKVKFNISNFEKNRVYDSGRFILFEYNFTKEEELNKLTFYINEDFNLEKFIRPRIEDLKVGDSVYLVGTNIGLRQITKIYDYPNITGKICQVEDGDKKIDILSNDERLVYPPYKEIESEQSVFNDCLNELSIQPFTEFENGLLNVFWKKIDDAASYTVSIFKIINNPGFNNVLHIKDYEVDRNDGYLAIKDLSIKNGTYAVVLKAESRNGDLIAKSRGMNINGRPRYWQ